MPDPNPPRARSAYDETIVFPRGFTVAVVEHLGDLVLRVELHDSARVERMLLTPHEARQIASLLRNGTELDRVTEVDHALDYVTAERDRLRARVSELEALSDATAVATEIDRLLARILDVQEDAARAQQERDRLRRELEALRDELRNGPGFRAVTLDAMALERRTADRLDAILRGEP